MIITFFGHSHFYGDDDLEKRIFEAIKAEANNAPITFYLGGYGYFDGIAKKIAVEYKKQNSQSEIIFVTPYIDKIYLKNREPLKSGYDSIIYPDIEKTPKRYAILKRNEWMIRKADVVIAYLDYSWGGASKAVEYAKTKNKKIINLGKLNIDEL